MQHESKTAFIGYDKRILVIVAVILAILVFVFTWTGIRTSRNDSLKLLILQGTAFTEALAQAAENAISSESFADYLVHQRYSEIVTIVSDFVIDTDVDIRLTQTAIRHNLYAVYICDLQGNILAKGIGHAERTNLPDFVIEELKALTADPEENYILLLEENAKLNHAIHYYIEITNTLDRVIVITADASYYTEALHQTQIGYLVQKMARETGVEYIIYQSTEGIIFSSRKTGQLLAIESDPFLQAALDSDTISHRLYDFQGRQVLELVRPFATDKYPFGLFRVGLSLDGYYAVSRAFDRQMILLAFALFGVLLLGLLYVNSRQKRRQITRRYTEIKSVTDTVFDQMHTGVATVDTDGMVTMANRAFMDIFGVQDITSHHWDELPFASDMKLSQLFEWEKSSTDQELGITVNGTSKTILFTVSSFQPGKEKVRNLVIVVYDITRLKEYEQISTRRKRLSELGNLAAGVAHEIRNPLNAISIAAQRLGVEYVPEQNKEDFLSLTEHIRSETRRLNEIITRFLALARDEKKQQTRIDLSNFLQEIGSYFRVEAEPLGITLHMETEPNLTITADPDKLKQLFTNLFNNSREAFNGKPGVIHIAAYKKDNSIQIRFADDGPGIKEELREKVFTPYFTTKEAGTGLGLPTVYKIITDMGGSIHIEDSTLGGVCFVMTIAQ